MKWMRKQYKTRQTSWLRLGWRQPTIFHMLWLVSHESRHNPKLELGSSQPPKALKLWQGKQDTKCDGFPGKPVTFLKGTEKQITSLKSKSTFYCDWYLPNHGFCDGFSGKPVTNWTCVWGSKCDWFSQDFWGTKFSIIFPCDLAKELGRWSWCAFEGCWAFRLGEDSIHSWGM